MRLRLATYLKRTITTALVGFLLLGGTGAAQQWADPFPSPTSTETTPAELITLQEALQRVARANPTRQEFRQLVQAATARIEQAGLRPNPEIELEAEEFGGDLPGFDQAEFTAGISQEIELWGKRTKRRLAAQSELDVASTNMALADFDLYGETSRRYYALAHAQNSLALAKDATDLATNIITSVESRLEQGAAMISELLLSELELQRARLDQSHREYELASSQDNLSAMWSDSEVSLVAVEPVMDPEVLSRIGKLLPEFDKSREVAMATSQVNLLKAQLNLQLAENKPNLSVGGGLRHARVDGANSFVFGLSMPLPFFDRGQGSTRALQAEGEAAELSRQQALISANAEYRAIARNLKQFKARRKMIHDIILPQAQETYLSLRQSYEKGKVIYSVLLQGEQTMIEMRAELNDLDLALVEQVIALEQLLGVRLLQTEAK